MGNKRLENSVKNLINLYSVVIGVALTLAIAELIKTEKGIININLQSIVLFFAFIITVLPFYHGALRHLDDAYIEKQNPQIKSGALIFDFMLLFIHGFAFVILSRLLLNPGQFAWILIVLLIIDIIWGIFVYYGSSSKGPYNAEGKWAILNAVFVIIGIIALIIAGIGLENNENANRNLAFVIMLGCILRTLADYYFCRAFYFPKP